MELKKLARWRTGFIRSVEISPDRVLLRSVLLRLVSAAGACAVVSAGLRWRLYPYEGVSWEGVRGAIKNSFFDVRLVTAVCLVAILLSLATSGSRQVTRAITVVFYLFCLLVVVTGAINITAINLLGGSVTFQWLYYADFFATFTSRSAIASALNQNLFFNLLGGAAAFALIDVLLGRVITLRNSEGLVLPTLALIVPAMAVFVWWSTDSRFIRGTDLTYAINPLTVLIRTTLNAGSTDLSSEALAISPPVLPPTRSDHARLPPELARAKIRNVLVIVLESVGANSVPGTGPAEAAEWMPNLARYADNNLRFRNIYAHVAYSTKSLYALLTARYPTFTYKLETHEFGRASMPTLSSVLGKEGYRTAFFMSGDLDFQAAGDFVARHGFDQRTDMSSLRCDGKRYIGSTSEWTNLDSVDDGCTADAVSRWIDREDKKPFFGVFWTGNTHWPYFSETPPPPGRYSEDGHRNRYIGALRASDAAIGKILDHLARARRLDDTLVVVLGDHGEAFREHGFPVHGNSIFEEEVHIPLIMINPALSGMSIDTLGGIIDIAPTIYEILGFQPPPGWEGRSLFDSDRPSKVFMFSINQDMVIGYREGIRKYIYQTTRDRALVYDLKSDPGETVNLADSDSRTLIRRYAAGWLKDQEARNAELAAQSNASRAKARTHSQ